MPKDGSEQRSSGAPAQFNGCRECQATCIRFAEKRKDPPRFRSKLRAGGQWLENYLGDLFAPIEHVPTVFLLILAVVVLTVPFGASTTLPYVATGTLNGAPASITIEQPDAPRSPGNWDKLVKQLTSRWAVLLALGGAFSLLRAVKGLAASQTKYLKMDLTIDPTKANDEYVMLTTFVENTLDDARKIHNALVLIGSVEAEAQHLLQSLSDAHPAIHQRVWCGQQLDSWQIEEATVDGVDILRNTGATWTKEIVANPKLADMECLLAACPLDPTVFVAGHGKAVAVMLSVPFDFDENDNIDNERVSFPVALRSSLFARDEAYIARFYILGEQPYPDSSALSRCTAKFVIPSSELKTQRHWFEPLLDAFLKYRKI